jgi:hypothetical protein
MIQLIKWGEPMHTSGRIYHRGSIKLPDTKTTDIMLLNNNNHYEKIGEATLIENEIGLFATNTDYYINVESLNNLIGEYHTRYKKVHPEDKYYSELTIACMGKDKEEYKEEELELKFLYRHLLTNEPLKDIIRDLKLQLLV